MLRATHVLNALEVRRPTLLVDTKRVRRNIERMARKMTDANVRFRPHFKTHQSTAIGAWFREVGVDGVTVSSLDMAEYFADDGWSDITVAFPLNVREIDTVNRLASRITLHLVVDSHAAIEALESRLTHGIYVWIKVDVGGRRSGVSWTDRDGVLSLAQRIVDQPNARFAGLLTHAGHSYEVVDARAVRSVHSTTVARLSRLRTLLSDANIAARISIGDTPCCSIVDEFDGVDEARPGNFVFYDLTQAHLGACQTNDIAVNVACPVVGKHPDRGEIVLYGGAVHLSKDALVVDGATIYGYLATWRGAHWGGVERRAPLVSLSQEHGVVRLHEDLFDTVDIGDLVTVVPVHSCLTTDLYSEYRALDGTRLPRRQSNQSSA